MKLFDSLCLTIMILFVALSLIQITSVSAQQSVPLPESNPVAAVIPKPSQMSLRDGQFILQPETTIYVEAGKSEVEKIGRFLSDRLSPSTGLAITVCAIEAAGPPAGSFLLTTRDADPQLGEEGYPRTYL
jgi:hypothetical protein